MPSLRTQPPTRSHRLGVTLLAFLAVLLGSATQAPAVDSASHWAQWRGPLATGEGPTAEPPTTWSEDENIRWKIEIPGEGHATPIVWGQQIFILTAIPATTSPVPTEGEAAAQDEVRFVLMAIDRGTGKVLWERVTRQARPHEGMHKTSTRASSSPVTDGEVLIASFGSNGIYGYTLDGAKLWEVDLGDMATRNAFGEGASPALFGDTVVINWDHEGESFIVALDKRTGKEKWRQARDEPTSWATPLIVERDGKAQVIVNATNLVRSYDLATGSLLWSTGGMTTNTIPSPVFANGTVYVMSGFRGNPLKAIELAQAEGDLSEGSSIVWTDDRDTPYVPSPLLYRDTLYMLKHNSGILTAFDAASGKRHYGPERLDGIDGVYASPVAAKGHIYVAGREGTVLVLAAGRKLEVVAKNVLDDGFDASPALVDGELLLRGRRHLYCIAEPVAEPTSKPSTSR